MPQHVAVNPLDHKALRIRAERSDAMGDGVMCCITFPEEFRNLQASYPILFRQNDDRSQFMCLAMFGFENGENLFLENDQWQARYMPIAMDVQPFMIGVPQDATEDRKVVVDLDSPRIAEGEGERIFDESGMPTPYLETISKKLDYLDTGFKNSADYVATLQQYDLLEPLTIDVTLADGSQNRLVGFHTIHEEKLGDLQPSALTDLQAKGYLLPTYMVLASLSNLATLIDLKNAQSQHGL